MDTDRIKNARELGYRAAGEGKPIKSNPYKKLRKCADLVIAFDLGFEGYDSGLSLNEILYRVEL